MLIHRIRGVDYRLEEHPVLVDADGDRVRGLCSHPRSHKPRIRVREGLDAADELDTWVHEVLHAAGPDDSEEAVIEKAHAIAGVLWKLGYRRCSKPSSK